MQEIISYIIKKKLYFFKQTQGMRMKKIWIFVSLLYLVSCENFFLSGKSDSSNEDVASTSAQANIINLSPLASSYSSWINGACYNANHHEEFLRINDETDTIEVVRESYSYQQLLCPVENLVSSHKYYGAVQSILKHSDINDLYALVVDFPAIHDLLYGSAAGIAGLTLLNQLGVVSPDYNHYYEINDTPSQRIIFIQVTSPNNIEVYYQNLIGNFSQEDFDLMDTQDLPPITLFLEKVDSQELASGEIIDAQLL